MKFRANIAALALAAAAVEGLAMPQGSAPKKDTTVATSVASLEAPVATKLISAAEANTLDEGEMIRAHPPDFDPNNEKLLIPAETVDSVFVGTAMVQSGTVPFCRTKYTFNGPSIDVTDSNLFKKMTCEGGDLKIVFNTKSGFNTAQKSWPGNDQDFYLISYHKCSLKKVKRAKGTKEPEEYFIKITDITFDATALTATGTYEAQTPESALKVIKASFGKIDEEGKKGLKIYTITNADLKSKNVTGTIKNPPLYKGAGVDKFLYGDAAKNPYKDALLKNEKPTARRSLARRDDMVSLNVAEFGAGPGYPAGGTDKLVCPAIAAHTIDETAMDGPGHHDLTNPERRAEADKTLFGEMNDRVPTRRDIRMRRRQLARLEHERRAWNIWGALQSACRSLASLPDKWAHGPWDAALNAVQGKFKEAVQALEEAGRHLINGKHNFKPLDTTLEFNYPNPQTYQAYGLKEVTDPAILSKYSAKKAFMIAQSTEGALQGEIVCVDCGVFGKLEFHGEVEFSIADGIQKAFLMVDGNLDAGFEFGMDAKGKYELKKELDLVRVKLGAGINIPGILDFGPTLEVAAGFDMVLTGTAQLNAGIRMKWEKPTAKLDLVARESTHDGWKPKVTRIFHGNVKMDVTASLEVPVTFGFNINILKGMYDRKIQLIEKPRLQLETGLVAEIPIGEEFKVNVGSNECRGIPVKLSLENTLYFNGLPDTVAANGQYPIWNAPLQPVVRGCYQHGEIETTIDGATLAEGHPFESDEQARAKEREGDKSVIGFTRRSEEFSRLRLRSPQEENNNGEQPVVEEQPIQPETETTPQPPGPIHSSISPPPPNMFEKRVIMSHYDGTYLATENNGLVYLDTYDRNCAQPAHWLVDPLSMVSIGDAAYGEANHRILHAFFDELDKYSVARLRVSDPSQIPDTAEVMFLKANKDGDIFGIIPGDDEHHPYFILACEIVDQPTKIFVSQLHEDDDGFNYDYTVDRYLKGTQNEGDLTGGNVRHCTPKSLRYVLTDHSRDAKTFTSTREITFKAEDHIILRDTDGVVWPKEFVETQVTPAQPEPEQPQDQVQSENVESAPVQEVDNSPVVVIP